MSCSSPSVLAFASSSPRRRSWFYHPQSTFCSTRARANRTIGACLLVRAARGRQLAHLHALLTSRPEQRDDRSRQVRQNLERRAWRPQTSGHSERLYTARLGRGLSLSKRKSRRWCRAIYQACAVRSTGTKPAAIVKGPCSLPSSNTAGVVSDSAAGAPLTAASSPLSAATAAASASGRIKLARRSRPQRPVYPELRREPEGMRGGVRCTAHADHPAAGDPAVLCVNRSSGSASSSRSPFI